MEQTLEELELEISEAEKRWLALLEDPTVGPKPRVIKRKLAEEEPAFKIFPLPNVNKSRGGVVAKLKKQLEVAKQQLLYEEDQELATLIRQQIKLLKDQIKLEKRSKRKNILNLAKKDLS